MQTLEHALTQARDCARCGGVDGMPEVHVTPNDRHCASSNCWCEPEAHYRDPATYVTVYRHRETC